MALKANVKETLKIWNREYKKGFFSYITLLMLREKSMYGFEIINRLQEITNGQVAFQASGIYQVLKKLSNKGFVTEHWQKSDKGPRRKYYNITNSGDQLLEVFTRQYILPINDKINKMATRFYGD